jgi:hypothetical protein
VEDRREVNRQPLMTPVSTGRRNGGEGKRGAEEVEGWRCRFTTGEEAQRPGGDPGGGSFGRPVVAAWHCRRRKKTP